MKMAKCSLIDEWIKKLMYTHSGILCRLKKEGNSKICNNMDESQGHDGERIKLITERQYCMIPLI